MSYSPQLSASWRIEERRKGPLMRIVTLRTRLRVTPSAPRLASKVAAGHPTFETLGGRRPPEALAKGGAEGGNRTLTVFKGP